MSTGAAEAAGAVSPQAWRTVVPIRFSHCDPAGIVYFARYFDMFNGVVEDWFGERLKIDYHTMIGTRRIGLGYVSVSADFMKPSRMGDRLECAVLVTRIGNASLGLAIHGFRDQAPAVIGRLVMVTTSLETHTSIPLPDDLRAAVEQYQETCK
jgi:acyl-CoA thioesterase FadM